MNSESTVNAYLRSKVMSATPEQLRLMLIEGAIRFCNQGLDGLLRKDFEQMCSGFASCRNILLELTSSVRAEVDEALAKRVQSLYTFMYLHLVEAGFERDADKAKKVVDLLEFERQTWVMLMDKLAQEQNNGAGSATASSTFPQSAHSAGSSDPDRQHHASSHATISNTSSHTAQRAALSIEG